MEKQIIKIGQYYWKPNKPIISRDFDFNHPIKLTQKQMELLDCLYEHSPNSADKDVITNKIWQSQHISSESLPQLINKTRNTIGDRNRTVITHQRQEGYRLIWSDAPNEITKEKQETNIDKRTNKIHFTLNVSLFILCIVTATLAFRAYVGTNEFDDILSSSKKHDKIVNDTVSTMQFIQDGYTCTYIKGSNEIDCEK